MCRRPLTNGVAPVPDLVRDPAAPEQEAAQGDEDPEPPYCQRGVVTDAIDLPVTSCVDGGDSVTHGVGAVLPHDIAE